MLTKNVIPLLRYFLNNYSVGLSAQSTGQRTLNYKLMSGFAINYKKPEKPMKSPVAMLIEWMDKLKDTNIS